MGIVIATFLLAITGTVLPSTASVGATTDDNPPGAPLALTVNDRARHLNVEGAPRFGWLPQDADGNETQTAYQITVIDEAGDTTIWDSGKVASSQQSYVTYEGPELVPGTTYTWTVRTWDRTDLVSPWADLAAFDTGIGDDEWEGAQWINRDPGPSTALSIVDGRLRVAGGGIALSEAGADWTDQIIEMTVQRVNGAASIMFRSPDRENGYRLQIRVQGGNGQLRLHALVDDDFDQVFNVPFPNEAGVDYRVRVEAVGSTIRIFVDDVLINQVEDTTHLGGRVGFVETNNEVALFDDVSVATPDGTVLLEDDFSGDLSNWEIPPAPQEADDYTLARKEITVADSPVVRARLYMSVSHTAETYLNGVRAHRGGGHGYPGEQYYEATDVTDLIEPGEPLAIGVLYHWYGNGQGRPGAEPGLLVKLVVEHADGTRAVTVTDDTWRMHRATWFQSGSGTRNGEGLRIDRQDGRGDIPGWDLPGFDDGAWAAPNVIGAHPAGVFTHLIGQETRLAETVVHPVEILTADDGTQVADFGLVIPARPRVTFHDGEEGRDLTLRTGYTLQDDDGRVATSTLQTQGTNMTFPYIQRDGEQDYEAFTHLAFRYFELPGADEPLTVDDISAVVMHTDTPEGRQATFDSSDDTLDAVWDLVRRSAIYSVQEHFVDTPTREQAQFLGDTAVISYATMAAFAERNHTRQAIREFLQSADRYWTSGNDIGRYNAVYPNGDGKRDIPDYSQTMPMWVWEYFMESGDIDLLEEAYPYMQNTADYVLRHIPADDAHAGLVYRLTGGSGQYDRGIIDWPTHNRFGYDMSAWSRTRINALGVGVLQATGDIAEALGRPAGEVDFYRDRTAALIAAMNDKLRLPDGTYVDGLVQSGEQSDNASQLSTSSAIFYGIAPEEDVPELAEYLGTFGLQQGPMTVQSLLQALKVADRADLVHSLLTNEDDLGWADILAQGGTFTWESWVLAPGTNYSQSHGWGSVAAVDILETMLGIRTSSPGAATVDIVMPRDVLDHAAGSVHTQRGEVGVSWERREDGSVELDVEVPVNVTARVSIPQTAGLRYLAAGGGAPVSLGVEDGREIFEVGSGATSFAAVPVAVAAVHDARELLSGFELHDRIHGQLDDGLDRILIELSDEPRDPGNPRPCQAVDIWIDKIDELEGRPRPQPGLTPEMADALRQTAAAIKTAIGC